MRRAILGLAILTMGILVLAGCQPCEKTLEANKELIRSFAAATNAADWDTLAELVADDFVRHSDATADVTVDSREDFMELQKNFYASMPDQHIALEDMVAEGDKVATLGTYSGTMTGPMGDLPPTGKWAEVHFLTLFRIAEGKIAELWVEWDNLAMLSQLGLFPPPVEAEAPDLETGDEEVAE